MNYPVTRGITSPITAPVANPDGGFDFLRWFSAGEQGAWYDPSDLTTLFQDSAGTTPVTAVEQPVGLMKDKSGRNNHAFQATAGNRPTLSARVNLLTKTEDFSDAAWSKFASTVTANVATAPDGNSTADKLVADTTLNYHWVGETATVTASTTYTYSFYAKSAEVTSCWFEANGAPSVSGTYNLTTGVASGAGAAMTSVGNGWYRCVLTFTTGGAVTSFQGRLGVGAFSPYTGDGTSGIYIWGADLRPTNIGANLPAYQRVNTSTDYDTTGFPLYLNCNGTSTAMATNSIDFSATDKMTVVAGVRKLSDAVADNLIELGASYGLAGGFTYAAPWNTGVGNYGLASTGTITSSASTGTSYAAPISNVLTGQSAISTPLVNLRVNGAQAATSSATQGTGNYGNYPLYLFARAGTSLWFNGYFYGLIVRGATSAQGEVEAAERIIATKTGINF